MGGLNRTYSRIHKQSPGVVSELLALIFESSRILAKIQDGWKRANIVPVKNGNKGGIRDDLTSISEIIMEWVIKKDISKIEKSKMIKNCKDRSIKTKSYVINLSSFYDMEGVLLT